ncbi:MAG: site-specific integrase [Veillonellaceae bacterium]|nr:site-specific integrase [Veillonellaceae bacterium]
MAKKPKPRADGRYQIKRIVDGKAKFFYGATYDEAEASARAAGQHSITKNDTLATWLKYWLGNVVKANVTAGTLSNYTTLIDKHITNEDLGRSRLRDITTQKVRQFLAAKLETRSPRTVLMLHHFLKSSLQQAVYDAVLFRNPAEPVKRPKTPAKTDKYLATEVVRKLIDAAKEPRKTLLLVAWTSGLRREEILGLCWSDYKAGSLIVRRSVKKGRELSTELKTPSAYRTVPLPQETIKALNKLAGERPKVVNLTTPDLIFPAADRKPIEPMVLTRYFSRLCERYKIEATFHDLRHTYATNLAVAGVHPARTQYLMGHSKAQMTLDCYTHIRGGDMADIAQIVEKTMVVKAVVK